ncbi:MAG TPA: GNAT family N-acetyltransferase, partial [Flavitalea sp.]|nr:GNAT family N-acetyltransferase [Flavitalea sp.]
MILFETSRLIIRQWTTTDLSALYSLYSDPAVMQFIRATLTKEETEHILTTHITMYETHPDHGRYAVIEKSSNEFI